MVTLGRMKLTSVGILSGALAIGGAGAAAAYSAASVAPSTDPPAVARTVHHQPDRAQPARPGPRFRWAPCTPPAHLEQGTCVTDVTRTVVVPAPAPAPAPAVQPAANAAAPTPTEPVPEAEGTAPTTSDDAAAHESEHETEHETEHGEHEADD